MIQINLLPWREQLRQIKKAQFITSLVLCIVFSFLILLIFHIHYSRINSDQADYNAALSAAISEEQNALNEMSSQESEKKSIDVQLQFIIDLYNENYNAVRFLNDLIVMVPSSILIKKIRRNGNQITLNGVAKSESDVTQLLDYISQSPSFYQPNLSAIKLENSTGNNYRSFILTVEQKGN